MSEHPLDRVFRERLGRQQERPVDHLWAGIAKQQARRRNRRRLAYGGAILSALFVVGAMVLYFMTEPALQHNPQPQPTPAAPADVPTQPVQLQPDNALPLADANQAANRELDETIEITREAPPDEPGTTAPIAAINPSSNSNSTYSAPLHFDPNPSTLNRSRTSKLYGTEDIDATMAEIATAADELNEASSNRNLLAATAQLPLRALATEIEPLQSRIWMVPNLNEVTDPIKHVRPQPSLAIEATAGPAYAYQILKAKEEAFRPDLDIREISEFPEMSYSASLRLNYRLPSRVSLLAGISYTSIRNQFEYERRLPNQELELVRSVNELKLVEVPLMVGYELPGQRFNLGVSAGPVLSVSAAARGQYLTAESMESRDLASPDLYKDHAGLSWRINLSTSYSLGRNSGSRLLLEPVFTHYPRSFTLDSNPLSERYWVVGLQLGIRHTLR